MDLLAVKRVRRSVSPWSRGDPKPRKAETCQHSHFQKIYFLKGALKVCATEQATEQAENFIEEWSRSTTSEAFYNKPAAVARGNVVNLLARSGMVINVLTQRLFLRVVVYVF